MTVAEAGVDRTTLSYWFPKLAASGLPVPKTALLTMPVAAQECVWAGFDGKDGTPEQLAAYNLFIGEVKLAAEALGFPCFLRTDHTSGKHSWEKTCFVKTAEDIPQHVFAIAEFSECADIMGLPWSVWAVREYLPIVPLATCPHYGNMPVCREYRFFVDDGKVRCAHPYWPREVLDQGGASLNSFDYDDLCSLPIGGTLVDLAEAAGKAVGGSWSIDILETKRGWYVTDMAEAHKSFHWEGCRLAA